MWTGPHAAEPCYSVYNIHIVLKTISFLRKLLSSSQGQNRKPHLGAYTAVLTFSSFSLRTLQCFVGSFGQEGLTCVESSLEESEVVSYPCTLPCELCVCVYLEHTHFNKRLTLLLLPLEQHL